MIGELIKSRGKEDKAIISFICGMVVGTLITIEITFLALNGII